MDRLAIISGLVSGQRIEDVIKMGPQHSDWKDNLVTVIQEKTGKEVYIPIHAMWKKAIDETPAGASTLLYKRGKERKPYDSTDGVQKRMRKLMRRLGHVALDDDGNELDSFGKIVIPGETHAALLYTFHGLGKNATNYLAVIELSHHEIASITGMSLDMLSSTHARFPTAR